ncbi:MAG: hypothetical protein E2O68_00930 [Deltaproteobacteria bacterium]|nr:MAG: hypothetical protein E2O68_00930 [Deltaproteobacteria bacterium]
MKTLRTDGVLYDYGLGPVVRGHMGSVDSIWSKKEVAKHIQECNKFVSTLKRLQSSSVKMNIKHGCRFNEPEILTYLGYVPPSVTSEIQVKIKK